MTKSIKIIAIAVVAVMLCLSLASCAQTLNGTYVNEDLNTTYEFSGNKVKITAPEASLGGLFNGEKVIYEGTYEIDDDTITITLVNEDGEEIDNVYAGTFDFKEDDNGDITIGKTEFEKKD